MFVFIGKANNHLFYFINDFVFFHFSVSYCLYRRNRTNLRMAFLRRAIFRPHFFVRKSSSAHLFVSHYFVSHFFVGAKIRSAFLRIRISSSAHFFVKHFFVHAFLRLRKSSSAFLRPRKSSSPQIFVRRSSSANLRPQIFVRKFSSAFFVQAFLRPIKSSSANLRPQIFVCAYFRPQTFVSAFFVSANIRPQMWFNKTMKKYQTIK